MALYRKRPVEVNAAKWTGEMTDAIADLVTCSRSQVGAASGFGEGENGTLVCRTIDGNNVAVPVGAYLVLDPKGWPYPCDAEIFEAGHDLVED